MKKSLIAIGILLLLGFVLANVARDKKELVVVYPEELDVSTVSDTLRVEKKTADTIWLEFANKRNN